MAMTCSAAIHDVAPVTLESAIDALLSTSLRDKVTKGAAARRWLEENDRVFRIRLLELWKELAR